MLFRSMELVKQNRRLIMQYLGLFFTFTFPGILIGILLTYGRFLKDDEEDCEAEELKRDE